MKFLCDAMLGKLARWLRIMGYDTLLATNEPDKEIVRKASVDGRIVLTLDSSMRGQNVLQLPHGLEDQIAFLARYGLYVPEEPVPKHCPVCNGKLVPTTSGLPPGVSRGWVCEDCGKVYWEGSHWKRMREFLRRIRERVSKGSSLPVSSASLEESS